jgi:hypothetical protein
MHRMSLGPRHNSPLAGADLYDWIAFRRVSGGIARVGDRWFDGGRRVPGYVADTLTALCEVGLVRLVDLDRMAMARARLTDAGAIRYEHLCRQRQKALRVPAALGATGGHRAAADQIGVLVAMCRLLLLCSGHQERCLTCRASAVVAIPIPQWHNPPDAGRPPVEHAPGGRPATTMTLQQPNLTAADTDRKTASHGDTRAQS